MLLFYDINKVFFICDIENHPLSFLLTHLLVATSFDLRIPFVQFFLLLHFFYYFFKLFFLNYSLILITCFSSPLGMKLKLHIDSVASKDYTFFVLFCYDFNVHTIIHCLMNIKEKCLYKMPLASGMPFGVLLLTL